MTLEYFILYLTVHLQLLRLQEKIYKENNILILNYILVAICEWTFFKSQL